MGFLDIEINFRYGRQRSTRDHYWYPHEALEDQG